MAPGFSVMLRSAEHQRAQRHSGPLQCVAFLPPDCPIFVWWRCRTVAVADRMQRTIWPQSDFATASPIARFRPCRADRPTPVVPSHQITSPSRAARNARALAPGAFIVGPVLAVVVAIYTFWGPPWPTAPTFDPGFPSFGSPLDVPFNVTNKSAFFPINDLNIICGLSEFQGKGGIRLNDVGTSKIVNRQMLLPLETRPYVCPLKLFIHNSPQPQIEKATIGFVTTYHSWWPWGGQSKSVSEIFTLNATAVRHNGRAESRSNENAHALFALSGRSPADREG